MTGTAAAEPLAPPRSAWALLRAPIFRALWTATVASNVGSWMHQTGADGRAPAAARRYHRGDGLPAVAHLIHADTSQ